MIKLYKLINKIINVSNKAKRYLFLGFFIVAPLTSYATVEDDVAALDVRVTENESDIAVLENPTAVLDDGAALVHLRISCIEGGKPVDNCFDISQAPALFSWITDVRKPNAVAPLTIQVGEGQFLFDQVPGRPKMGSMIFYCDATTGFEGYITFQGAGRNATTIGNNSVYLLQADACEGMTFKDMKLSNYGNSGGLVLWSGGGSSVWENIDTDSQFSTWSSRAGSCGAVRGKHYWFSSRISNHHIFNHAIGYEEGCDESWFIGSEIQNTASQGGTSNTVFSISNAGEVHVYGGVIRSNATGVLQSGTALSAVKISGGGNIHIHGTGIDVISTAVNDIIALDIGAGGTVHAMEAAYNMSTAGGTITRLQNNGGMAMASYTWQSGAEPPAIISITGADTAMVTNTSDGHPHQVVYDSNCGSNWYDTTAGACR